MRYARRKAYRAYSRERWAQKQYRRRHATPIEALASIAMVVLIAAFVSFCIFLFAPPAVGWAVVSFWAIAIAWVLWFVRERIRRKPEEHQAPHRSAPVEATKACKGPLPSGKSPCPKDAQIPQRLLRCDYCERLRPSRIR